MKLSRLLLAALAIVAFVVALPARAAPAKPNVILVLVDALRADVLGPYGYRKRATTPNLDRFAGRSVVWENANSQNGWTVPCIAGLFSSLDTQAHRVMRYKAEGTVEMDTMSLAIPTVAEQFQAAGYTTSAFLKSVVVDSARGMSQGFEKYQIVGGAHQADGHSARELNDVAIPWILAQKTASKPFFTYLHYMDAHSPYKAPEPWYSKHKGTYKSDLHGGHMQIEEMKNAGKVPTPDDIERLYALYDAEVEYWDSEFGRLMLELVKSGLDENTIVVVTADHGEAFYEHGQWFHGHLYQENIHIPIIVKAPGVPPGRMTGWSQQIDIAPTLADLAGVPKPAEWMGRSQVAGMKAGKAVGDFIYAEYGEMRMAVDQNGMKLYINDGPVKLFDLKADPKEKVNLAASRPADVARLRALIDQRFAAGKALGAKFPVSAPQELSEEQVEALRALGYHE